MSAIEPYIFDEEEEWSDPLLMPFAEALTSRLENQ